jgi:hypothetical protein
VIFNGEMVRAILHGRKTQTRRIVKGTDGAVKFCKEWDINGEEIFVVLGEKDHTGMNPVLGALSCPFGAVGDRIWVREAFRVHSLATNVATLAYKASERNSWTEQTHRVPLAVCNKPATPEKWTPSLHMPRWASRILLEITDVRVERLNAISEEDARAEGIIDGGCLNCGNLSHADAPIQSLTLPMLLPTCGNRSTGRKAGMLTPWFGSFRLSALKVVQHEQSLSR